MFVFFTLLHVCMIHLYTYISNSMKDNLHVRACSCSMLRFQLHNARTHSETPKTHAELYSEVEGRFDSTMTAQTKVTRYVL